MAREQHTLFASCSRAHLGRFRPVHGASTSVVVLGEQAGPVVLRRGIRAAHDREKCSAFQRTPRTMGQSTRIVFAKRPMWRGSPENSGEDRTPSTCVHNCAG